MAARPRGAVDVRRKADAYVFAGVGRLVTGTLESPLMDDTTIVTCPYCGEAVEVYVEADARGTFVQDCEVCCNPWRVHVHSEDDERSVSVDRADGSE